MTTQNTENFYSSETILCDTIVVDICHYIVVKNHSMYNK